MTGSGLGSTMVHCPYCGENVEILVEDDLGGEMVWDCEVCCRPWSLLIRRAGETVSVELRTLEE